MSQTERYQLPEAVSSMAQSEVFEVPELQTEIRQLDDVTPVQQAVLEVESQQQSAARKWLLRGAFGALAAGGAATVALSPMDKLVHDVEGAAPWVGGGIVATEAMWIGGAAVALGASGKKVGNPLTLKGRFGEVKNELKNSRMVEAGLTVNTVGALGTASVVVAGAVAALPAETWPGAAGIAALDMASTIAVRTPIYRALHSNKAEAKEQSTKVTVRRARLEDIDRLADIDRDLFSKAYGEKLPEKAEVVDMLTRRFHNTAGNLMFVAEVEGKVEGFVTAFRTNKSAAEFKSWEDSTANGTLDGKVDPNGKYVYVANMTISRKATSGGAMDMLLANLFSDAIRDGVEYGYFESRMPGFRKWLTKNNLLTDDSESLKQLAAEYADTRRKDGKRLDWQLRMYEGMGMKLEQFVPNAFDDAESMNYGMMCVAEIPLPQFVQKITPLRKAAAWALRQAAKNPKILNKVF